MPVQIIPCPLSQDSKDRHQLWIYADASPEGHIMKNLQISIAVKNQALTAILQGPGDMKALIEYLYVNRDAIAAGMASANWERRHVPEQYRAICEKERKGDESLFITFCRIYPDLVDGSNYTIDSFMGKCQANGVI